MATSSSSPSLRTARGWNTCIVEKRLAEAVLAGQLFDGTWLDSVDLHRRRKLNPAYLFGPSVGTGNQDHVLGVRPQTGPVFEPLITYSSPSTALHWALSIRP